MNDPNSNLFMVYPDLAANECLALPLDSASSGQLHPKSSDLYPKFARTAEDVHPRQAAQIAYTRQDLA